MNGTIGEIILSCGFKVYVRNPCSFVDWEFAYRSIDLLKIWQGMRKCIQSNVHMLESIVCQHTALTNRSA